METHTDLMQYHPCSEGLEYARQFSTLAEAWDKCERGDWMIWLLRKKGLLDKKTSVILAVKFAERVLHIYEGRNPGKLAPRQAIEAAIAWIENPTEENRAASRNAANAAYAAANAAYAAAYAADAAYAAANAAYAAAYAAAAANAAADAADAAYAAYAAADAADAAYAAADARSEERKQQAEIIRSIVKNPFSK